MNKSNYYQIDRRDGKGLLLGYEMVSADSAENALQQYLKADFGEYRLSKSKINGKTVITATCESETSEYLEIRKVMKD